MEQRLKTFRNLFKFSSPATDNQHIVDPQIGFKVTFCEATKQLKVKVIGARQLPSSYGNATPHGYLVKIRVFPEKEKFETSIVKESWPTFNEEFAFTLHSTPSRNSGDYFYGKFISFTVYSVLENTEAPSRGRPRPNTLRRFLSFDYGNSSTTTRTSGRLRQSFRQSINSRRTVGAVTYNLDSKVFTQKTGIGYVSTPDIWRSIKAITSGIQTEPREGKKGCVEVTLSYAVSEDEKNDVVEVGVTRFRCGLQTMQSHEKVGGQLYIKITAFENEDVIQKMKSDKFDPTISLKIESNTATLRANVNNYNIKHMKILIRLLSANMLGKKTLLGTITIDNSSDFWKEIVADPGVPVTRMINFQ